MQSFSVLLLRQCHISKVEKRVSTVDKRGGRMKRSLLRKPHPSALPFPFQICTTSELTYLWLQMS